MRLLRAAGLAAGLFSSTFAAFAVPITGQISVAGYVEPIGSSGFGAATGLDFVQGAAGIASPGVAGGLTSYGGGSGAFAGLSCANVSGTCGSIQDILSFTSSPPISSFLSFTSGASTISFDLTSITNISRTPDAAGGSITLTASGLIHDTNYNNTAGIFTLTAEGNGVSSFSATILATPPAVSATTPEPSSLVFLATGIGGVIGLVRRRARS